MTPRIDFWNNLKIYLNGKRLRKKIIIEGNTWRFVRPLQLTKDDVLTYEWTIYDE